MTKTYFRSKTPPSHQSKSDDVIEEKETVQHIANKLCSVDAQNPGVKSYLLEMIGAMSTEDPEANRKNIKLIA